MNMQGLPEQHDSYIKYLNSLIKVEKFINDSQGYKENIKDNRIYWNPNLFKVKICLTITT